MKDEHFAFGFLTLATGYWIRHFLGTFPHTRLKFILSYSQSQFPKLDLLLCPLTFHPNGPPSRPALTLTWLQSLRRCDRWMPFFEAARPKSRPKSSLWGKVGWDFFPESKTWKKMKKTYHLFIYPSRQTNMVGWNIPQNNDSCSHLQRDLSVVMSVSKHIHPSENQHSPSGLLQGS